MRRICAKVLCVVGLVGFTGFLQAAEGGIKAGELVFSPFAELQSIYDSNVQTQPSDGKSDVSFLLRIGTGITNSSEKVKLMADVWGLSEKYTDLKDENHEDFGESANVKILDLGRFSFGVNESYEDIKSLDYSVGHIEARKLVKIGANAGSKITDKMNVNLAYLFADTAYDSPRQFDWNEHGVKLVGLQGVTDKTDGKLTVGAGVQSSDGNISNGKYLTLLLGVQSRQTEKLTGDFGIGVISLSGEAEESRLAFDTGVNWMATPKVSVFLNAKNGFEPSVLDERNYNFVTRATLGASWFMDDRFVLAGNGMYSRNDYLNPVMSNGTSTKKEDDTFSGSLRLTYNAPAKFLQLYVEGKYEDKTSTLAANEYSQTQVTLGAKCMY